MEDIKKLFKELAEEMEKDLWDWESIPETEADKTFKEKMIDLVKEKYGTEWSTETPRNPPKMTIHGFFRLIR